MRHKILLRALALGLTQLTLMVVLATGARAAAREKVLYAFSGGADGGGPLAGLISDRNGNLYGTTSTGGANGAGTVFELSPTEGGGWTETVLYAFTGGSDGGYPAGGVIFDAEGDLYGTTADGGANGDGTVFELSPTDGGGWTETVLHSFNGDDGLSPSAGLVFDGAGNLYGTTFSGGKPLDLGVVFELSPTAKGKWKEKVLLELGKHPDGGGPMGALVFDGAGNLYGTASGGYQVVGSVFELTPLANGRWKETILHGFKGKGDGGRPLGSVVLDAEGNVYGTTSEGGRITELYPCAFGCGTVFELMPRAQGKWKEAVLYKFEGGEDGDGPVAGLVFDAANNLYGTTEMGGGTGCQFQFGCGTVFELTPSVGGKWKEIVLHRFKNTKGGQQPMAGLILDSAGNLYGTGSGAGAGGGGVVFEITP